MRECAWKLGRSRVLWGTEETCAAEEAFDLGLGCKEGAGLDGFD